MSETKLNNKSLSLELKRDRDYPEQALDIERVIRAFSVEIQRKLLHNRKKGGPRAWREADYAALLTLLRGEVRELEEELDLGLGSSGDAIVKECADVAAFAMMIADKIRSAQTPLVTFPQSDVPVTDALQVVWDLSAALEKGFPEGGKLQVDAPIDTVGGCFWIDMQVREHFWVLQVMQGRPLGASKTYAEADPLDGFGQNHSDATFDTIDALVTFLKAHSP